MLSTKVSGEAGGEVFGDNRETSSALGAFFALGAEIGLGPGGLLAEVQLGYGGVDTYVLRDTSAGLLSLMVGYRLMFPMASAQSSSQSLEAEADAAPPRAAIAPPAATLPATAASEPAPEAAPTARPPKSRPGKASSSASAWRCSTRARTCAQRSLRFDPLPRPESWPMREPQTPRPRRSARAAPRPW